MGRIAVDSKVCGQRVEVSGAMNGRRVSGQVRETRVDWSSRSESESESAGGFGWRASGRRARGVGGTGARTVFFSENQCLAGGMSSP